MAAAAHTVHTPYEIPSCPPLPPTLAQSCVAVPAAPQRQPSRTRVIVQEMDSFGPSWVTSNQFGWEVLHRLWGLQPSSFDHAVLLKLAAQPAHLQQHLLLMVATMDVRKVKNPSALLSTLISECAAMPPVCLAHLAGLCCNDTCAFAHPVETLGWLTLRQKWQLGWLDFDYAVLNTLLRKPREAQDRLLFRFSRMRLRSIHNLSALLYSLIAQSEQPRLRRPASLDCPSPADAPLPYRTESLAGYSEMAESLGNSSDDQSDSDSVGTPKYAAVQTRAASLPSRPPSPPLSLATEPPAPRPPAGSPPKTSTLYQQTPSPASCASSQPQGPPPAPAKSEAPCPPLCLCGTERVLRALQRCPAPFPQAGWRVLHGLWGVGPFNFAPETLQALRGQSPHAQEHILLSIAAMDLRQPLDLNDVLRAALAHPQPPVCWRYLAGLCPPDVPCRFPHPPLLPGWAALAPKGVSYLAVDYPVLNVFLQLPPPAQHRLLTKLAGCPTLAPDTVSGLMLRLVERSGAR